MSEYKEYLLNLETDGPDKIGSIIEDLIKKSYENKDDKDAYLNVCEGLGSLILFLVRHDRFVFGIKEKKNPDDSRNMRENMN